jgi:hypothetical protein
MISARRTYIDPILALLDVAEYNYSFYDIYSKFCLHISPNDRISLSSYFGGDHFIDKATSVNAKNNIIDWGNIVGHLRYNKIWNSSFFSDVSLIYSKYSSEFNWNSVYKNPYIHDFTFKTTSDYIFSDDFILKFGGDVRYYDFNVTSGLQEYENNQSYLINAFESNLFLSSKNRLNEHFETNIGLSASFFKENRTNKFFHNIEPRIGLCYFLDDLTSLKGSYINMHQYLHTLSSTNFYAPNDVFYPSNEFLKPMKGNQISLGITRILKTNGSEYECNLDIYYKDMKNLPQFKQSFTNADPYLLSSQLIFGNGWGYGAEFQIAKHEGRISGWLNYTWNKAFRHYKEKNKDKAFVPKFHREHQLNLVLNYNLSNTLRIGASFVLASGQPITLPVQKYFIVGRSEESFPENQGLIDYGEINGYRLPTYNRLDLSLVHPFEMWGGKWELFCSVYNIYNYKNPTFLTFDHFSGKFYSTTVGRLPTAGIKFYY